MMNRKVRLSCLVVLLAPFLGFVSADEIQKNVQSHPSNSSSPVFKKLYCFKNDKNEWNFLIDDAHVEKTLGELKNSKNVFKDLTSLERAIEKMDEKSRLMLAYGKMEADRKAWGNLSEEERKKKIGEFSAISKKVIAVGQKSNVLVFYGC